MCFIGDFLKSIFGASGDMGEGAGDDDAPSIVSSPGAAFPGIAYVGSPNFGERKGALVDKLIWHYTAGPSGRGAVNWFAMPDSKVSAHFVIDRDGTITQCVPLDKAAWHAGDGAINRSSIGVEVTNVGRVYWDDSVGWTYDEGPGRAAWTSKDAEPEYWTLVYPDGHGVSSYWVPYTPKQKDAMLRLVKLIEGTGYAPATRDMRGHEDILPTIKTDPGPLFPWTLFSGRYTNHGTRKVEASPDEV